MADSPWSGLGQFFGGGGFQPRGLGGDQEPLGGYEGPPPGALMLLMGGAGMAGGTKDDGGFLKGLGTAAAIEQKYAADARTTKIKEYQFAKRNGYQGSFQDWVADERLGDEKSSMTGTHYYIPDPDNPGQMKLQIGQLRNRGGMGQVQLPPGAVLADPQKWLNTGSGHVAAPTRAPAGSAPIIPGMMSPNATPGAAGMTPGPAATPGFVPIDNAGKARDKEVGEATGKGIAALPAITSNAVRTIQRLEQIENHPGLNAATGFIAGKVPIGMTPAARDAMARIEEVRGETWTQAVQDLRGLGALSNAEGNRIESARSRLIARDVTTEDYKKAIKDVKEVIQTGVKNARLIASGKMKPYTETEAPETTKIRKFNPETGRIE